MVVFLEIFEPVNVSKRECLMKDEASTNKDERVMIWWNAFANISHFTQKDTNQVLVVSVIIACSPVSNSLQANKMSVVSVRRPQIAKRRIYLEIWIAGYRNLIWLL